LTVVANHFAAESPRDNGVGGRVNRGVEQRQRVGQFVSTFRHSLFQFIARFIQRRLALLNLIQHFV